MAKTLNILWIDDDQGAIARIQENIISYCDAQSITPDIKHIEGGTELPNSDALEKMDMLVIDYKLDGENGAKLIVRVRESSCVADILLYSENPDNLKSIDSKLGHYGTVEIVVGRAKIEQKLLEMINKNLNKFGNIVTIRGLILSEFVNLESELNHFLSAYYKVSKNKRKEFETQFLENRHLGFFTKRDVLILIQKQSTGELSKKLKELSKDLDHLNEMRNKIAHCKEDGPNQLSDGARAPLVLTREVMLDLRVNIKKCTIKLGACCKLLV